jgi:deoxycytidylate deaminase
MKTNFFNLAKQASKNSNHHEHKIGCVIAKGKRIFSIGWNSLRTHPDSPHKYKSVHAEFHAINNLYPETLRGSSIYIYRERKNGDPALSKPCPSCMKLIKSVGIKNIYYTNYLEVE